MHKDVFQTSMTCQQFHRHSIDNPEEFWGEQAVMIDWHKQPYSKVLDYSNPPFAKWFVGGETNLCYNAVDRHLEKRGDQAPLIYTSTETDQERVYTFRQLHAEVNRCAAVLQNIGVGTTFTISAKACHYRRPRP
jgi:propionyl-CoA synthetase